MKTLQILLRHRMVPIKARSALRQMCVWVNPASQEYIASYDPLVAKWSAFEKDMADVRSQREGPLRWNPPSYINEDFLMLQKNQPPKPRSRRNSNSFYHRSTPLNIPKQNYSDAQAVTLQKRTPELEATVKIKSHDFEEEEEMSQKNSSTANSQKRSQLRSQDREPSLKKTQTSSETPDKTDTFIKMEPSAKRTALTRMEHKDAEEELSSMLELPNKEEIISKRGATSVAAFQENLSREVPLEDVTVKEVSQKLARPSTLEVQTSKPHQKKTSRKPATITRKQYEEESHSPQRVTSPMDLPKRRTQSKEMFLREISNEVSNNEAEMLAEPEAKESPKKEMPVKVFTAAEESLEESENLAPIRQSPIKSKISREVSDSVESVKETFESEPNLPEWSKKSHGHYIKKQNIRAASTNASSPQEEIDEGDVSQDIVKTTPLQELPKKKINSGEQIVDRGKRKTSLQKVSLKEPASMLNENNYSEDRVFQKSDKHSNEVYSFHDNSPRRLNEEVMVTPDAEEGMAMKESTTFNKKKYEALRKYIAEAEVELRVQKQMLNTQREDFKKRLRRLALNPLAEIERSSKVHLQHPLEYFNQKKKILRTKKPQRKLNDEVNTASISNPKTVEATQSRLQENLDAANSNDHSINVTTADDLSAESKLQNSLEDQEMHQFTDRESEGNSRRKNNIQERSKDILNVESSNPPQSNQKHKIMPKHNKTKLKSKMNKDDIPEDELGENQLEKMSSRRSKPLTNIKPANNVKDNVELLTSQEINTSVGRNSNMTRSRSKSNDRYDYFESEQTNQNPLKRKSTVDSYSDKSVSVETSEDQTRRKTQFSNKTRVIDSQPSNANPVVTDFDGSISRETDNLSSITSREKQEISEDEIYEVSNSQLKQAKGGQAASNQVRASSLLDRSRSKLQKHFMDRSAPIRLNKNSAYIYQPSESTISTMTKSSLDAVDDDSQIPPVSFSSYAETEDQVFSEENLKEDSPKQDYVNYLTNPSDLVYLPEQSFTHKPQKPSESNLTSDPTEDSFSGEWDNTIIPTLTHQLPLDDPAVLKTHKDHISPQSQNRITNKGNKLSTSISNQDEYKKKIDNKEAYATTSRNKPIPEYNYYNNSVDMRPYVKNNLPDNSNLYFEKQKTKLFSVSELSAAGKTTAPEKYDSAFKRSESSTSNLYNQGSNERNKDAETLPKTDITNVKRQMRSFSRPQALESFVPDSLNDNQPTPAHMNQHPGHYDKSIHAYNSPKQKIVENQNYSQMSAPNDFNDTFHEPRVIKTRHIPDSSVKSEDKNKRAFRSREKLYSASHNFEFGSPEDSTLQSKKANLSENDFSNSFQKSPKRSFTSEPKGAEVNETLQDIEEGIPSSRVKLRPPLDAFTSFGVGRQVSEANTSSPYSTMRSRSRESNQIASTIDSQTVRSHSLPSKPKKTSKIKINSSERNPAKAGSLNKSRSISHSSNRSNTTKVNQPSRRVQDRYPALFKNDPKTDPFHEAPPFTHETVYSPPIKKKSSPVIPAEKPPLKIGSTKHNKPRSPAISHEQAQTMSSIEWSDRTTNAKEFVDSTYSSSAVHKSYRFDPPVYAQSAMSPGEQDPLDQSTKRTRSRSPNQVSSSAFTSSPRAEKTEDSNQMNETRDFPPMENESLKKRKPLLYKKSDLPKTKFRSRFVSPSSFDVENIDSFFRVDESIQVPGSPIRKWKVVPKERGRAIYVASIPQSRVSP